MGGPGRGAFCGIAVVDDHVVQPLVPWEMSFERTPTQTDLIGRVLLCRFGVFLGLFPSVVPPHARCTHEYDNVFMWNDVYGYLYDFCFFLIYTHKRSGLAVRRHVCIFQRGGGHGR